MSEWQREVREIAGALGSRARRLVGAIERTVDRDPYHAVGYRGYGTRERVLVLGRVMQNERIAPADPAHSDWRNLVSMLHRLESDPLPFARVRATLHGTTHELGANDEGFLHGWMELSTSLPTSGWHQVGLELPHPSAAAPTRTVAHVLTPPSSAAYGVVSDMDDTVLQSEVTNFLRAARMLLLENARTRLPFSGVAAFYRALEAGEVGTAGNPIFYVSSSPWNLYDVIADFLEAQAIPTGPLLLRDWDLGSSLARHQEHKTKLIRGILETYPILPFILVGDSSQEDPEIYSAIVREHPKRILAIYIRNVASNAGRAAALQKLADEVRAAGSTMVIADDTLTVARHAAAHGWIDPAALASIGIEARRRGNRRREGGDARRRAHGRHADGGGGRRGAAARSRVAPVYPRFDRSRFMRMTAFAILTLAALPPLTTAAVAQAPGTHSPHAGKEARDIKALSAQEQKDFLAGQGAGFAIPAEMNHYPGPRHVLDLAPRLGLSPDQVTRVRATYQNMHSRAVTLGREYVERERQLDRGFAEGKIDESRLRDLTAAIGRLRSELRFVHLRAHLQTTALLTPEQIGRYDELRGYTDHTRNRGGE